MLTLNGGKIKLIVKKNITFFKLLLKTLKNLKKYKIKRIIYIKKYLINYKFKN